jgi:DNA repair photolyase
LACGHQCTYCSTAAINFRHQAFGELGLHPFERGYAIVDPNTVERVKSSRPRLTEDDVVQVCTTTDAWAPESCKLGLGREIVKYLLEETPAQVRILTKSAEVRQDFDVMKGHEERVIVGLSTGIPPTREDVAQVVEPNASPVTERLATIREANERGLRTYGMICPSLPGVADSVEALNGLFAELKGCAVEDIWLESVNGRGRGLIHTAEALREAGLDGEADAVDAVRSSAAWSSYTRRLIENAEAAAKAVGVADRLHILLYPSKLSPADRRAVYKTSKSVIWLWSKKDR